MELNEDQIIEECGNTLLPYEYQWTCVSCKYNVIKRKQELSKKQRKKTNFFNSIKYAGLKKYCKCVDVHKNYEGDDFNKIYEFLFTIENKKLKLNKILTEKYKDMNENLDFKQYYWSKIAIGINKIGNDSVRNLKWLAYYDRFYYENLNYDDLMGSVLKCLTEISERSIICWSKI